MPRGTQSAGSQRLNIQKWFTWDLIITQCKLDLSRVTSTLWSLEPLFMGRSCHKILSTLDDVCSQWSTNAPWNQPKSRFSNPYTNLTPCAKISHPSLPGKLLIQPNPLQLCKRPCLSWVLKSESMRSHSSRRPKTRQTTLWKLFSTTLQCQHFPKRKCTIMAS